MDSHTLRMLVECPLCLEVRWDVRYFQCVNNHHVCEVCLDCLDRCPQGRCSYHDPPMRDRKVEQLIENSRLELSCRFTR